MYPALYLIHILAVVSSGLFFLIRGLWMIAESPLLQAKWVRISPHIIDTVLLSAAIGLMIVTQQYPRGADWLTVKIIALLIYIGLGMVALRRGRTKPIRVVCFVAAVATFGFMVSVALTRSVAGLFSLL